MLDGVADVAPVATDVSGPRSPDTRAAPAYLEASGAGAISITSGAGHIVINVGFLRDAVAAFWLPQDKARAVAARARSIAGDADDVATVVAALKAAAVQLRVTLTAHDTAMMRAGAAAERLDEYVETLRASGVLKQFTRTYKQRRLAAAAKGEGFMTFAMAELRFKRALIPLLQSGGKPAAQSIFAQVFDT
jgi:hypothetical protein